MAKDALALEEWRRLYELAGRIKELAPWQWMQETDVFGVQNPETGELGFVSVMGQLGEHLAIAVYLGADGLYGLWTMENQASQGADMSEILLGIPQLQASFEDRQEQRKEDLEIIKQLGLKFRGKQAWPQFRTYRPGYLPWFMEAGEAQFLACALEQALEVTPRIRQDPSLLPLPESEQYLVRVFQRRGNEAAWQDQIMRVPPPEPATIRFVMNKPLLDALKKRPRGKNTLEVDFFMFPTPFQDRRGERPAFAFMLMVVDAASGLLLSNDLLKPDPTIEDMWGQIPLKVVEAMARVGIVPQQVSVTSPLLMTFLPLLAEELGFKLKKARRLPMLEEAKAFLLQRFV